MDDTNKFPPLVDNVFAGLLSNKSDLVGMKFGDDITEDEIKDFLKTDNVRIYSTDMAVTSDYVESRINVCYDEQTLKIIDVVNG